MAEYEVTIGHVYEIALTDWGISPDEINDEWTEELLALMFEKRADRLRAIADKQPIGSTKRMPKRITNKEFFRKHGIQPKQVVVTRK